MSDSLQQPFYGIAIYNPDLLSKKELLALFVARRPLLRRLLDELRVHTEGGGQHHLLVGQRGMGKTTLLRRLRYAIEDDPELDRRWLPLTFPEEQYNVVRLSDLYVNCIDALGDALQQLGQTDNAQALDDAVRRLPGADEEERAHLALTLLMEQTAKTGKRLVLLLDNLDLILDRLRNEQWAIRELLSHSRGPLVIGASSQVLESSYSYSSAFYDYFQIDELRALTEAETHKVLVHLSRTQGAPEVAQVLEQHPARLRTLHTLTGGNPRTAVLLFNVLALGIEGDVQSDLQRLLDYCTPLYKARVEALSTQAQQVLDALAIHWDPISAGELAGITRLDTNVASSQLNRLTKEGLVEKVEYYPETKTGFQIAERFFNIWYLMRASRRVRAKLIWLVEFLKLFYAQEELKRRARHHLRTRQRDGAENKLRHAEYSLALARAIEDNYLRGALEDTAIRSLVCDDELRRSVPALFDFDGLDAVLKDRADLHRQTEELRRLILAAKIQWNDQLLSAEEFWRTLSGFPAFTLKQKLAIAEQLEGLSLQKVADIYEILKLSCDRNARSIDNDELADQLFEAVRLGYMEARACLEANAKTDRYRRFGQEFKLLPPIRPADEDVDGARIAAEALHAPGLPAIAMARRLGRQPTPADSEELKAELPKCPSPRPWYEWALAARELFGASNEIEWASSNALARCNRSDELLRSIGALFTAVGRRALAESAYSKACEVIPSCAYNWMRLGDFLVQDPNRADDAEAAYREATRMGPRHSGGWIQLGALLERYAERASEAEAAYRIATEVNAQDAGGWLRLGRLLARERGRSDEAEAALRSATRVEPSNGHVWIQLADQLAKDPARDSEAEATYRKATKASPKDAWVWVRLGDFLALCKRHRQEAEVAYRRATEVNPRDSFGWRRLGQFLSQLPSGATAAEAAFRKAIKLDPNNSRGWIALGDFLARIPAKHSEAEVAYRSAIDADPKAFYSWIRLGALLARDPAKLIGAEAAYRMATTVGPRNALSWRRLGDFLARNSSRYDEAEAAYRKATEVRPQSALNWVRLGDFLVTRPTGATEAEAAYRVAIGLNDPEAMLGLAKIRMDLGDWAEAESLLRRAISEHSVDPYAQKPTRLHQLLRTAARTGNAGRAVALLDDLGVADRWRPLREALAAANAGTAKYLRRVNPEIRPPAEKILSLIDGDGFTHK
jgi:tetratricopeptide (TPR) repeat protein